ncbi:hypothetical protein VPHD81_0083 [Vibrio phage D81]
MGPRTEFIDFIFPAFILVILVFCWIAKQVCEHQDNLKAKAAEKEEEHCHFCGDGEFFQVGWDSVVVYEGPVKKVEGTSMVHRFVVRQIICPECGRKSQPSDGMETIPAPRFNYNRHL